MSEQETLPEQQPAGFSIGLVWFVLFRRKRLVVAFLVLGLLAALAVWHFKLPVYRSTAALMVPYISDSVVASPGNPGVIRTSTSGDNLINAEVRVLRSYDLCEKVARSIGPEKLAPGVPSAVRLTKASEAIVKNLNVEVTPKSIIIEVSFDHPDSSIVQPVLENLIQRYFERHEELHEPYRGSETNLNQRKLEAQARLDDADKVLRGLKAEAGIISSVDEARKSYAAQTTRLESDLMEAKSQLAMQRALFKDNPEPKLTNAVPVNLEDRVPEEARSEFKTVSYRLEALRARESELRDKQMLLDEHPSLKGVMELIAKEKAKRDALLREHPMLAAMNLPAVSPGISPTTVFTDMDKREAFQAKVNAIEDFLAIVRTNALKLEQLEPSLADAQRRRESEETILKGITAALDRKRFNATDGSANSPNIGVVQAPTPAAKVASKRLKTMGMLFAGCLGTGLGLAFFLELFVDRTVKRPSEIEPNFKLPLLMAVPAMRDAPDSTVKVLPDALGSGKALVPASDSFVPAWSPLHFIHPYTEALSNRVAMYFEFVKRKPKLVGVTSCSDGAGVSSIAAGLAAALSESGDGRVLIVDMHRGQGATQTFFQGQPVAESAQLLNGESSNGGAADQNMGGAAGEGGNRTLPTGLKHLLPKLKASDYDYIIFDMPKVSMASMSLRLSALLDLTVLVVESEKVQSDVLKRNCAMLTESGAKVGVVMNKVHKYVPEWLHTEV